MLFSLIGAAIAWAVAGRLSLQWRGFAMGFLAWLAGVGGAIATMIALGLVLHLGFGGRPGLAFDMAFATLMPWSAPLGALLGGWVARRTRPEAG